MRAALALTADGALADDAGVPASGPVSSRGYPGGRDRRRGIAAARTDGRRVAEPAEDVAKAGNEGGVPPGERGFATLSGEPVEPVYRPGDLDGFDPDAKLGAPGAYPFTRGVYPSMYRGRLWTMRQFAGFGTPAETNERYRFLLERGQGGLSVAFDMPTLMGIDSDDPRAEGEVGRCGVATDTLEDFVTLFDRIPLGDISTSMTISGPAVVAFAFFLATAERQGVPWERAGRHAADRHHEGVHRAEGVDLPATSAPAIDRRPDGVLRRARASLASGERVRLSHPRGRRDGGAGARVHAGRRVLLRRAGADARSRRRHVRAGPVVLLQRAHRLLRGDRETACGAEDLGTLAARAVRRHRPQRHEAPVPHPDGRRVAHGAATDEQRRPNHDRGVGRGAGRDAIAAHERARRGARAPHGGQREARAPHAAGHRVRERRARRDRSARAARTSWSP